MIKLYYTPKSHFARKVRILIDAWGLDVELIDVGNVADSKSFGDNPLMKVPALLDGKQCVIDSDNIAQYLTRKHDSKDQFEVLTTDVDVLNTRAVMNGIMAAEVEILLAKRTGIDISQYKRFDKMVDTINSGLKWLEQNASIFSSKSTYLGFHLVSLWDHLALYTTVEMNYPKLQACVERLSQLGYVGLSVPR
jgi:glutathione S-transferase